MSCAADATNTICFVLDAMVCSDVNTHTHSGWHTQFAGLLLRRGYSHRRLAAPPVCNSGDRVQHSVCHGASPLFLPPLEHHVGGDPARVHVARPPGPMAAASSSYGTMSELEGFT